MSYVIKNLKHEDLDRIYPPAEDEAISMFTHAKRQWPQDMHGLPWAIDEGTDTFLVLLPRLRIDVARRYLFGMPGGVVLIRFEKYCLYSFLYVSPGLQGQLDEVKRRIRDIFKMAGTNIDGTTHENSTFAVPNAQFKD